MSADDCKIRTRHRIALLENNTSLFRRFSVKKIVLLLALLLIPALASAADDSSAGEPRWSLEFKGGSFTPSLANWDTYYGSKDMPAYALAMGYKLHRMVEVGASGGLMEDSGQATAPLHGTLSGSVKYTAYPIDLFVLLRGVFSETQFLVPYVGGGFTRIYYTQKVEAQGSVNGKADGYHVRGGVQLLLDNLDMEAANNMYRDYGVYHTYLFIESEYVKATVKSGAGDIDLGGTTMMFGLLFEY